MFKFYKYIYPFLFFRFFVIRLVCAGLSCVDLIVQVCIEARAGGDKNAGYSFMYHACYYYYCYFGLGGGQGKMGGVGMISNG